MTPQSVRRTMTLADRWNVASSVQDKMKDRRKQRVSYLRSVVSRHGAAAADQKTRRGVSKLTLFAHRATVVVQQIINELLFF